MKLEDLLNKKGVRKDKNGIWVTDIHLSKETKISQITWKNIYNQNLKQLQEEKNEFNKCKLADHMKYIEQSYTFSKKTIYLEIGCGPAFIGEYLIKKYDCYFVGVDFNYKMLLTLKKYFEKKGYTNYLLIHADISNMPLKENCIDYIYGGGVIEHLKDTGNVMDELYRVLKKDGISFNTVPAFNLWWPTRFWNNIPNLPVIKQVFELIHISLLKGAVLNKYFGYELSYTLGNLKQIHTSIGFKDIKAGSFVFHPSEKKLKNSLLRKFYMYLTANILFSPVYYIYGEKKYNIHMMYKNIIPSLLSLEINTKLFKKFNLSDNFDFYPAIKNENKFHYTIVIDDNINVPDDYDFRNGHFYKKGNIWYYKRKIGFFTLKFSYNLKNKIFAFNKIYFLIPFEIGHIWPVGRHIFDLINLDLFLNGYIFIRGCAVNYKNSTTAFIGPSFNGKTSLIESIIDKGGKYISEEYFILDIKTKNIFPSSCLTAHGRLNNLNLNRKLNDKNIIKEKVYLDKLVLFLNKKNIIYVHTKKDIFDFIILRSLYFFKNDFIKSYIFVEDSTEKLFEIINKMKSLNIQYKFAQMNNFKFDDLISL